MQWPDVMAHKNNMVTDFKHCHLQDVLLFPEGDLGNIL